MQTHRCTVHAVDKNAIIIMYVRENFSIVLSIDMYILSRMYSLY